MRDIISRDPKVEELIKQRSSLEKQMRHLNSKINLRVEKILLSKLKTAVSQHKWRIVTSDNYSREDPTVKEITLELIDNDKDFATPILAKAAYASSGRIAKHKQRSLLSKKMIRRNTSPDIRNYRDFLSFAERWDIDHIVYKNSYINFSYGRIRIASSKSNMDDVYSIIRAFEFPLDLSVQISDLEKMESDLRKRRELMQDLSSKSLFSL